MKQTVRATTLHFRDPLQTVATRKQKANQTTLDRKALYLAWQCNIATFSSMTVHFSCQATEKHCMVSLNTVYLEANFMHTIYQLSIHYIYLPITHTVNLYCNKYWFHPYKNIAAHHMNICNTKVTLIIAKFTNTRRHEYHYHHIKQTVPSDHIFPPPLPSPEGCSLVVLLAPHHHLTLMCISEQRNGLSVKGSHSTYVC